MAQMRDSLRLGRQTAAKNKRSQTPIQSLQFSFADADLIGRYRESALMCLCVCDASEGDITVFLPSAKISQNTIFIIKKSDTTSNNVYIEPTEADEQVNAFLPTAYRHYLDTRGSARTIISDGTDYHLIGHIP